MSYAHRKRRPARSVVVKKARKKDARKFSKPDLTEWRRIDWKPPITNDFTEEDYLESEADRIAQAFWAPKGKKYPVWHFSLRHGMDPADFSKRKDLSFSINYKRDKKSYWRTGVEIMTIPAMIAFLYGAFLTFNVELSQEERERTFRATQKAMAEARKRQEQEHKEKQRQKQKARKR